ncbi:MAG: bacterial Ig-like domain-containing protein [Bacilli bacterium]|nr:bacterial Ig-like domain-containing protein [Bacilli bacterium]
MKVKKLLTLLVLSALLVGCGNNAASGGSQIGSSSAANSSQSDNSSSADGGQGGNSQGGDQGGDQVTLVSISVTAPTKVAYLIGDQFDPTGLVVTATMSDNSTRTVESGYELSNPDMSSVGTKTVTVTYQGKTATFDITVAKPTAWGDQLSAAFAQLLNGYVPPFFYGPDMGVGELSWSVTKSGVIYAEGGNLDAAGEGEDSPLKPFADLLVADGFVATTEPGANAYHYALTKELTVDNAKRYVNARIATCDADGRFAASGEFYFELSDPYYYSWEATGLEAAIKAYFEFTEDIPDIPAGALFSKNDVNTSAMYIQYKMSYVPVNVLIDAESALAYLGSLTELDPAWTVLENANGYVVISPEEKIRVDAAYDPQSSALVLAFSKVAELPADVVALANLLGVSKFLFGRASATSYNYSGYVTLGQDEKDLNDLFNRYDAALTANNAYEQKGKKEVEEDEISANFYNADESRVVSLTVGSMEDEEGNVLYGLMVEIDDFEPIPDEIKNFAKVVNLDPYDVQISARTGNYLFDFEAENSKDGYNAILNAYIALLDADAALDEPVFGYVKSEKGVQGDVEKGYIFVDFIGGEGDTRLVRIFVYDTEEVDDNDTPEDDSDDFAILGVEIDFMDYNPAPESEWADALAELLEVEFKWDNDSKCYFVNDNLELGENDTLLSVAQGFGTAIKGARLGRDLSLNDSSKYGYVIYKLYSTDGYIEIQVYEYEEDDPETEDVDETTYKYQIAVYFFKNPDLPAYVNGISSAIGVEIDAVGEEYPGYYASSAVRSALYSDYVAYFGAGFGEIIGGYYPSYYYIYLVCEPSGLADAEGLGFAMTALPAYDAEHDCYIATYANEDGWTIKITLYGDGESNWTGYFSVVVIAPAEEDEGE